MREAKRERGGGGEGEEELGLMLPSSSTACHHHCHGGVSMPPPKEHCTTPPGRWTSTGCGCPIDALKLDACVDVLGGLVHAVVGRKAADVCCPVLGGLVDLDAGLCLCTTIRAKLLSLKLVLPIALQVLIDCGKRLPSDYQCPST